MDFLRRLLGRRADLPEDESPTSTDDARPPDAAVAPPQEASGDAAAEAAVEESRPDAGAEPVSQSLVDTGPLGRPSSDIAETAPLLVDTGGINSTRQLPLAQEIEAPTNITLRFGYRTDVGRVRSTNQDSLTAQAAVMHSAQSHADFGLFAVADGMGGHLDGEKASALVVSIMTEQIISQVYLPLLQREFDTRLEWDIAEHIPINEVMVRTLQRANTAIASQIPNSGTTATLSLIIGNTAYLAHIGDTRAYTIDESSIEQLTRDHSLAQRLFEVGQLSREEMMTFPRRNELYKVLGFTKDVTPDISSRRLIPGSFLLICSDGLWGEVPDSIIQDVVLTAATPQSACDQLVDLANERGGHDNVAVVVIQIPSAN